MGSINLQALAGGAVAERINQGIQEVVENIADVNTDYKPKRKVTVELVFATCESRDLSEVEVKVKTKLAPKKSVPTKFIIDKDLNGEVLAAEYKKQIPGQTAMEVDQETGEITSSGEERQNNELKGLKVVK